MFYLIECKEENSLCVLSSSALIFEYNRPTINMGDHVKFMWPENKKHQYECEGDVIDRNRKLLFF